MVCFGSFGLEVDELTLIFASRALFVEGYACCIWRRTLCACVCLQHLVGEVVVLAVRSN